MKTSELLDILYDSDGFALCNSPQKKVIYILQFLHKTELNFEYISSITLEDALGNLRLEFDQLIAERDYYQFTLILCDAQWNKVQMAKAQYLDGIGYENLENYVFSNSTLTQYVHYSQNFPTENTMPKYAGNYLLVVYRHEMFIVYLSKNIL